MTADFRADAHGPILRRDGFGIRRRAWSKEARCVRPKMASFGRTGGSNRGSDQPFGIAMQAMGIAKLLPATFNAPATGRSGHHLGGVIGPQVERIGPSVAV